ncbi:MAG: RluA family pseudouridine synthase [Pyrinomonadaceae bacterium]
MNFKITPDDAGMRLDAFLAAGIEGWSRSRLQKLIDDEEVLVNGKKSKSSYKLSEGDEIEVELAEPEAESFEPENIPLEIVYEDEFLAVINKPAGLVVHPGAGVPSGTLANAIAWHFGFRTSDPGSNQKEIPNPKSQIPNRINRVGIVHRLDKDTSGLIVVAKNERTHETLAKQFRDREVFKSYVALVHGAVRGAKGKIDAPVGRDRYNRLKMTVAKTGRHALSIWRTRRTFEKFTLLDVEIKTGRTHQIRVHLASINHPVVGDALYNEGRDNTVNDPQVRRAIAGLNRFFLHSERLSFRHPVSKEKMNFQSPLPKELNALLGLLG